MRSHIPVQTKSEAELRQLLRAPLAPEDREAIERELATRQPSAAESKDQLSFGL